MSLPGNSMQNATTRIRFVIPCDEPRVPPGHKTLRANMGSIEIIASEAEKLQKLFSAGKEEQQGSSKAQLVKIPNNTLMIILKPEEDLHVVNNSMQASTSETSKTSGCFGKIFKK